MPKRRKFLIGAGSLAAGTGAMFGTTATTTYNVNDRNVDADIVSDTSGVFTVNIVSGNDLINETNDELEIDFTEGGASGINVGSEITFTGHPDPDAAGGARTFDIRNQSTAELTSFELAYETDSSFSSNANGSFIEWAAQVNGYGPVTAQTPQDSSGSNTVTIIDESDSPSWKSNQRMFVSLKVAADEPNSDSSENLSGALRLTASE